MCGRFSQGPELAQLEGRFCLPPGQAALPPRYNLAPGQDAALVVTDPAPRLALLRWGLVPAWAKDPAAGNRPINARAETVAERPIFKGLLRRRRALVLADGFYEWSPAPPGRLKQPHYFRLAGGGPFAMAGLWDTWRSPQGLELATFTIVTTRANSLMAPIHDRMPAILRPQDEAAWLDPGREDPAGLLLLLAPHPPELMSAHPVSTRVNRVGVEGPELIRPAPAPQGEGLPF